jgi:thiol-disulfide isomerase/thioredoxin
MMKTDVQSQLKDYWQAVYDATPEIEEADVREPRIVPLLPTERTFRLRPVWVAGVAAVAVLVLVGGTAWLFGGGAAMEPADGPELVLPLVFPVSELPPFQLDVRYQLDPAFATGPDGEPEDLEALMTVAHGGPDLLRVDVNRSVQLFFPELNGEPGPPHKAAGSFVVLNHDDAAEYDAADGTFFLVDREAFFNPLDPLIWETWKDICTFGEHEFLEPSPVAGRETVHIGCTNGSDSYELWVDAETGLMLRIVGKDIPGNLILISSAIQATEYEVLSVAYEPPFAPDTFSLSAPPGATIEDFRDVGDSMATEGLLEGTEVPELAGEFLSGGEFTLADLEGSRVALLFWGSWCEPCLEALDELAAVADELTKIMFVTVLIDDRREDAGAVLAERQIILPTVDLDGPSEALYGDQWGDGIPLLVLVETDGTVAAYHPGFGTLDLLQGIFEDAGW